MCLTNFCKKYLQNLKYNAKRVYMYFSFDFGWYSIHVDIVSVLLNRQKLLSVTKVNSQQSLKEQSHFHAVAVINEICKFNS